eukprot:2461289-Alexandrium_andersonii.AAC.1
MSASLVGSEMCIRDSRSTAGARQEQGRSKVGERQEQGRSKAATRQEPVSYTHLTLPTICSV